MKKLFKSSLAILIGLSLTITSCKKEDSNDGGGGDNTTPETFKTTKKALFIYYTGSECNPCGSAGIPNYEGIVNDLNMKSKVVGVALHTNAPQYDSLSDLTQGTAASDLLGLIVSGGSYSAPTFLIPPYAKYSGASADSKSKFAGYVNTIASQTCTAAVNVNATIDANGIYTIKTKTKFLADDDGNFKVSVWVLEDGIKFQQVANGVRIRPYTHNDVFRNKFSSSTFGDDLISGPVKKDQIVEKEVLGTIPFFNPANPLKNWSKSNLSVVVVVWKHKTVGSQTTVEVMNCERVPLP